jgi:hypothetical protein
LVECGAASHPRAIEVASLEIARACGKTPLIASLALQTAITRLIPSEPPNRPDAAILANPSDHRQHGPAPSRCWFCDASTWWKLASRTARWLCARCSPLGSSIAAIWHEARASDIEDACREPCWTETPDQDDYLFLRVRKLAREAARTAADLLGAWRPPTPRTSADLRTLDWQSITDAAAIIAAAEELRAWSIENAPPVRVIACRALAGTIDWPLRAIAPFLDRALDLLRWMSSADAIAALGSKWPADHAAGSSDPVLLRIDAETAVYVPAHPHLHMLLRGIQPVRKSRAAATQRKSPSASAQSSPTIPSQVQVARGESAEPESTTAANVAHAAGRRDVLPEQTRTL